MNKPEIIIFDWDNTLVNSKENLFLSFRQTLQYFGLPPIDKDECHSLFKHHKNSFFPKFFGENYTKAVNYFNQELYKLSNQRPEALPGAFELLSFLKEQKIPLLLVSNKTNRALKNELCGLGWEDFFDVTVGSGDSIRDKPYHNPVFFAISLSTAEKVKERWFIGDTPTDWLAAIGSGCKPIALWEDPKTSMPGDERLLFPEPISYFKSCEDLQKNMQLLFSK